MISIWATILVAFLSSASALLAGYMTNRSMERRLEKQSELERRREVDRLRLEKSEEICFSLPQYKYVIYRGYLGWVALTKDEISVSDLSKKSDENLFKIDLNLVMAKLGLYFPDLLHNFEVSRDLLAPANKCYFRLTGGKEMSVKEKRDMVNIILDSGSEFDDSLGKILLDLSSKTVSF